MSPLRPLILSQPAVIATLVVAFGLIVATALLGVVATREVARNTDSIARAHETILTLQQVMTAVADAEAGQRGFLLTGDENYLQPYRQANERIDPLVQSLRSRLEGDSDKIGAMDQLAGLISTKRIEMEKTITLRGKGSIAAAINLTETDSGRSTMEGIRRVLQNLESRELRELNAEGDILTERSRRFQYLMISLIGFAVVLTAVAGMLLARRIQELATMVTVCAWTKRVKWKGRWVSFEEFLQQRFNLRFSHGMSEEAAKQLQVEEVESDERQPLRTAGEKATVPMVKS
ncbi:MAG TPA: CHASE3 domain-containing protein [Opitutaceae bacterium]|nr:CHASE3 domain-containing protein [Opitutaceae bacterium]